MAEHNILGKKGEELALKHLITNKYKILNTNWRDGNLEIDIIAQKDDLLHIIEVKTRQTNYFGEPEEFITRKKQRQIIKATDAFIEEYNINIEVQFDIISILCKGDNYKIHHIENAFYPLI